MQHAERRWCWPGVRWWLVAITTPVHVPGDSSDGGLQEGSGGGWRDVDRIEGCAGTVFTGLGDRWGREGARIMPRALVTKWATMTGTQVEGLSGEGRASLHTPRVPSSPAHSSSITISSARQPVAHGSYLKRPRALEEPVTQLASSSCLCLTWILPDTQTHPCSAWAPVSSSIKWQERTCRMPCMVYP